MMLFIRRRTVRLLFFSATMFFIFTLLADRVLSLLGVSSEKTIQIVHPPNHHEVRKNIEFEYTFATNSRGIRYEEIPLIKPEKEYRVIVLGDSFVEGAGVEMEKTFTTALERIFSSKTRRVRFINFGLTAQGPVQYARALFQVGYSYNPDAVLLCIYANDLSDTPENTGKTVLDPVEPAGWRKIPFRLWPHTYIVITNWVDNTNKEETHSDNWINYMEERARNKGVPEEKIARWKKNIPPEWARAVERNEMNHALLSWGLMKSNYWVESLDIHNRRAAQKWETMSKTLQLMIEQSRLKNMKVGMIFIPFNFQYDPRPFERKDHEPWQLSGMNVREEWLHSKSELERRLELWAKDHSTPFLNLTPVFRQKAIEYDNLNFPIDGHWTLQGHRVATEAIEKWLKTESGFAIPN